MAKYIGVRDYGVLSAVELRVIRGKLSLSDFFIICCFEDGKS